MSRIAAASPSSPGPRRKPVPAWHKVFLAMLVAVGCDGAIIDPTEKDMMITLCSARAVMGEDEYCVAYLEKVRAEGLV